MSRSTTRAKLIASVLLTAAWAAPLGAQTRDFRTGMRTAVGYSAVVPDALLGASAFHMVGGGIGLFVDWKMTSPVISGDDRYCPPGIAACTETWVLAERNDLRIGDDSDWLVFNAGVLYALTPEFAVMVGAGMARDRAYAEFLHDEDDPELRLTETGRYWVDLDPQPGWGPQLVTGALLRAGRTLTFRFGWESAPGGMSFGAYFVLP